MTDTQQDASEDNGKILTWRDILKVNNPVKSTQKLAKYSNYRKKCYQ